MPMQDQKLRIPLHKRLNEPEDFQSKSMSLPVYDKSKQNGFNNTETIMHKSIALAHFVIKVDCLNF